MKKEIETEKKQVYELHLKKEIEKKLRKRLIVLNKTKK